MLRGKYNTRPRELNAARHSQLKIAFWPDYTEDNPYQALLYNSLGAYGFSASSDITLNTDWLANSKLDVDVVHIHWPQKLWNSQDRTIDQLRMIRARCDFLRECKRRKILRVWTLHNWTPHSNGSWVDRVGNLAIAAYSDLILVHSESVRRKVSRRWFMGRRTMTMPSGNYCGYYPTPRPPEDVRRDLGLSLSAPTCCMLGHLRSNKGISELVHAAERLGDRFQWIIAGHVDDGSADALLASLRGQTNVRVIDERIDDQQFADYATASDCFVLPYHQSTGSGALLAALSFGRAVVASNLPAFTDLFPNDSDAAVFVRPRSVDSLLKGIERFFSSDVQLRHQAAMDVCAQYDWENVIGPVAERFHREIDRIKGGPQEDL